MGVPAWIEDPLSADWLSYLDERDHNRSCEHRHDSSDVNLDIY